MKDLSYVFAFINLKLSHRKWLSGKDIPAETSQESDLIWDRVAWINFPAGTFWGMIHKTFSKIDYLFFFYQESL